jgi:hypothetical protein
MEVLASMFVICIGLLGVLAVIPYGAYQTAKARNAENTSWILDAAVKELEATGMAKPTNWIIESATSLKSTDGTDIFLNHPSNNKYLNCSRFLMVDPFTNISIPIINASPRRNSDHIFRIGTTFTNPQLFRDRMTGQDDLVYTTHTDKRTDFSGQNNKILSSGQYTWFFMFQPSFDGSPYDGSSTVNYAIYTNVASSTDVDVIQTANVDILGCYNRVPGSEHEQVVLITSAPLLYYGDSISVNIPSGDYDLKNTKYVFLSWNVAASVIDSGWYKVINATESTGSTCDVFLKRHEGTLYSGTGSNLQMLIIPGVMYHKRVPTPVTIR